MAKGKDSGILEIIAIGAIVYFMWKVTRKRMTIPLSEEQLTLEETCKNIVYKPLSPMEPRQATLLGKGYCSSGDLKYADYSQGSGDPYAQEQADAYSDRKTEEAIRDINRKVIQFRLINTSASPITTKVLDIMQDSVPFAPTARPASDEVLIGSQIWKKVNVADNIAGSFVYNGNEANRSIYGGLYSKDFVTQIEALYPGYRVPTYTDIQEFLTTILNSSATIKEAGTTHWTAPNTGATNTTEFTALPGGHYSNLFGYGQIGMAGIIMYVGDPNPNIVGIQINYANTAIGTYTDNIGTSYVSVRLIKGVATHLTAPVASAATSITATGFTANWSASTGATKYYLDVATDSGFTSYVSGYQNLNVSDVTSYAITGLTAETTYYYRIRAYNTTGTSSNSNTINTTTISDVYTDYDGNVYTTVIIGSLLCIVENLKTTHYADGSLIPNLTSDANWAAEDGSAGHNGAYCSYDNDPVTNADYGLLYNKYAVDNPSGLCYFKKNGIAESGWRITTHSDIYDTIGDALGGASVAGAKMKESGTTHWGSGNTGTNTSGFTGLGTGERQNDGTFDSILESNYLWASDLDGVTILSRSQNGIGTASMSMSKRYGCTVRCVKDI